MDVRTSPRRVAALVASALFVLGCVAPSAALALDVPAAAEKPAATEPDGESGGALPGAGAGTDVSGGTSQEPPAAVTPDPVSVSLSARVTLSGRALAAGELSVELLRDGTVVQKAPCAADGTVVFAPVVFTEKGTAAFALRMAPATVAGVTVDDKTVPVDVAVEEASGALVASVAYDGSADAPVFSNVYRHPAGWEGQGQSRRYYLADGTYVVDAWHTVDGLRYRFDGDGHPRTGWYDEGGNRYYLDPSTGAARTGWLDLAGQRFYLDPASGARKVGWADVDGQRFWLRRSDNAWGPKGSVGSGWLTENGQTYFLRRANSPWGPRGSIGTGWLTEGGQTYFLRRADSQWGPKGSIGSGWLSDGGHWYFLRRANSPWGPRGSMGRGWLNDGGTWYHLSGSGAMDTGWLASGGRWYWLSASGAMATGWAKVGGSWYYLDWPSGAMWANRWVSGIYWVGSSGSMATNAWVDGGRYWVDGSGRWTRGGAPGSMGGRAQGYSSPTPYLILVDNGANRVGVYRGGRGSWTEVRSMACSCGKRSTPTVRGTFSVGSRGYSFGENKGYSCYYWTQFYGDYLFHSILYNPYSHVVQDGRLGAGLSHGCVRLAIGDAKWIYDTIPRGTTVVSY